MLKGSKFLIDPEKIGYETCAYIGLNLKDPSSFDAVVEALRNIPEVVECHYTTGDYDMFIKIYAHNNHHLLTVIHDQLQPLGLSRSETIISFGSAFNKQLPIVDFKTRRKMQKKLSFTRGHNPQTSSRRRGVRRADDFPLTLPSTRRRAESRHLPAVLHRLLRSDRGG